MSLLSAGIWAVEQGLVPDAITRHAIRALCHKRLEEATAGSDEQPAVRQRELIRSLRQGPIAVCTREANQQHYELPSEFFAAVLGPRLKYSCALWESDQTTLAEAEEAALATTCERAGLTDGQDVLELGCGWGSLSLWMAEHYPQSRITAVSNSAPQRRFIEGRAAALGLKNLRVVTADINDFQPNQAKLDGVATFDRVVSVEMFEHLRNYQELLARVASWLRPDGKAFVHIFCHRQSAYFFDTSGEANWMGRYFFTGGLMPSSDLLTAFDRDLKVTRQWQWSGEHYRRTAEAWLANLDDDADRIQQVLSEVYGQAEARRWLNRWRMFFLAVAELFGFADGREWFVGHYLLEPAAQAVKGDARVCHH